MNTASFIVLAVIAAVVIADIAFLVCRRKKNRTSGGSCAGCSLKNICCK